MSKDIFCGVGKIPKGSKLGSMKQCADKKQIRYWGEKKVDARILESIKNPKKGSKKGSRESRDKVALQVVQLRARVNALTKKVAAEKDKTNKDKLQKELVKTKDEFAIVNAKLTKLNNERDKKGGSRKGSRKGSRRGSRKGSRTNSRGGSRKGSRKDSRKGSRKSSRKGSKRGSRRRSRKQ